MRSCRVLITSAWFEPGYRGGGPVRSVAAIIDTVDESVEVVLVTSDRDLGDVAPYAGVIDGPTRRGRASVHHVDVGSAAAWARLLRELRWQRFDLLYVNSLWDPRFTLLFLLAARFRLLSVDCVLVAPRGELAPGALSMHPRRKRAFLRLVRILLRSPRVQWHASTMQESAQIRAAFPAADVIVVEPQTTLPRRSAAPPAARVSPLVMVFLSRIAAKKNLDLVLRALGDVSGRASLDIYGPIEDPAYWLRCLDVMARLPSHVDVTYRGEASPAEVRATFSQYDVFVFPTRGENFGHVVAESLSVSCAVVCSAETPWTPVLRRGGGRVLPVLSSSALTHELDRLLAMSGAERHAMREQAGAAYDEWRLGTVGTNVVDEWRQRRVASRAATAAVSGTVSLSTVRPR